MSLQNLGNVKKAIDLFNDKKVTVFGDALKNLVSGRVINDVIDDLTELGVRGDDLVDILDIMKFDTKDINDALERVPTSAGKSVGPLSKMGAAFSGLAAKVGALTTALGLFAAAAAGIALVYAGIKMYDNYIQGFVDSAKTAGDTWESSNKSLSEQTLKITELKTAIDSGTLL